MAATPSRHGYWIADANGAVRALGDAPVAGDLRGQRLSRPIIALAGSTHGYWLTDSLGQVRAFSAPTLGSAPAGLNRAIVGMAATPSGNGYWLVAADGGVFNFGDAVYAGSLGGHPVPVVGIATALSGYWILGRDGHTYPFGGAPDMGSGADPLSGVGVRVVTVHDSARPTPSRGGTPAHAGRTLPTTIFYPTDLPSGPTETGGADPAAGGPFPLIVFAHGFAVTPLTYRVVLHTWAEAGYVVAAPEFPISGADGPGSPGRFDLPEQPGDLSAVISYVTTATNDPSSWIHGLVDPGRVGEAGQSDGGATVAGAILDSAAGDARPKAAVIMSGAELAMAGGSYGTRANAPVLIVQGSGDPINPPSASEHLYADAHDPKGYLDAVGAGHLGPYLDASRQADLVRSATVDFFDLELWGEIDGLVRLQRDGNSAGLTQLRSRLS